MIVSLTSSLQRRSSFKPFWRGDLFIFFIFISFNFCFFSLFWQSALFYLFIFISFNFCFFKPFWQTASQLFFCLFNFPLVLRIFPQIFKNKYSSPIPSFREAELSPAQREELLRQLSQWPTKQVHLVVTFLLFTFFVKTKETISFAFFLLCVFIAVFCSFVSL